LYRGINDFKKGYQTRCDIVKDEKGDLVTDSHSIVARWRNYFSQLFNVLGVNDVGQAEIHTAEPPVPEPSAAEVELAIDKLKSQKSPGIDQIRAELIKAGGRAICLEINKLITSIRKKEKLPGEWKESIIIHIHKKGDKTDCNNYGGISLLPTTYKILSNTLLSRLIPYAKEIIGDHQCDFRRNRSTYLLTPWCRVLLEKLTGLQLVKKFPSFYGTRRFITALTNLCHPSLSWASPIQSIYPHPTSWRSILILPTHLRLCLPSGLFPFGFHTKTLYTPLSSPIRATCLAHLILLDFITRTILDEEYTSFSSSLCNLLHSPVTSSLYSHQHLILKQPQLPFLPQMSTTKFHTHTKQPAKLYFYIP